MNGNKLTSDGQAIQNSDGWTTVLSVSFYSRGATRLAVHSTLIADVDISGLMRTRITGGETEQMLHEPIATYVLSGSGAESVHCSTYFDLPETEVQIEYTVTMEAHTNDPIGTVTPKAGTTLLAQEIII